MFWTKEYKKLKKFKYKIKTWIALDIDDTLAQTTFASFEYFNDFFKTNKDFKSIDLMNKYKRPYFVDFWNHNIVTQEIINQTKSKDFTLSIKPIKNSKAISAICKSE